MKYSEAILRCRHIDFLPDSQKSINNEIFKE